VRVEQISFTGIGRVEVTRAEVASSLRADQVLLATSFVGICGSDLAVLTGHHPWTKPPVITGHEVSGRVLQVGPEVSRLAVEDHVVVNPLTTCGICPRCRQGAVNQCESAAVRGFRLPGAAATRVVITERELHKVPDGSSSDLACLAEPLAAAWHAASRWDDLTEVAVIGAGNIGQLVVASLRCRGAGRITVVEPVARKRDLACQLGAHDAVAPDETAAEPSFTAIFDCVSSESTLDWAARATLAGGAIIAVGVPDGPLPILAPRMQRFEIALLGSGMYTPEELDTAVHLISSGQADVAALISDVYPLDQAPEAYARAQQADSIKVLVAMS